MKQETVNQILSIFSRLYPNPRTALHFGSPFELLVAAILSAQCTDKKVNQITSNLFNKWNTPEQFASLRPEELEGEIKTCGLHKVKSRYIIEASKHIVDRYHGEIPNNMDELMTLPGVGRKVASVIMAVALGQPALPVDTHVFRVSRRIGMASGNTALAVETELRSLIPEHLWRDAHHWLIAHGREVCKARRPHCSACKVSLFCKSFYNAGGL